MQRRKAVPQHRTVAEVDAGLKAVAAEYRAQLATVEANAARAMAVYTDLAQDAYALRNKVAEINKLMAQEVFNAIV